MQEHTSSLRVAHWVFGRGKKNEVKSGQIKWGKSMSQGSVPSLPPPTGWESGGWCTHNLTILTLTQSWEDPTCMWWAHERQPLSREAVCPPVVLTTVLVSLGQHSPFQWGSAVLGAGVAWKRLASRPAIRSPEQREEKPELWLQYRWLQVHDTVPSIFTAGPGIWTQALMLCSQGFFCLRFPNFWD